MNLRVDLILKIEQRSPNMVSLRNLRRVAPVLAPLVLIVLSATVVVNHLELRNRVRMAEDLWQEAEPRKAKAIKTRQRADDTEAVLKEFEGWQRARIAWNEHLLAIQRLIRPDTQLDGLRMSQVMQLVDDKWPGRVGTLVVSGIATGPSAETDVQSLTRQLHEVAPFADMLAGVDVQKYDADPQNKANRVFQIQCKYKPLRFHEAPRKQAGSP